MLEEKEPQSMLNNQFLDLNHQDSTIKGRI